MSSIHRSKSNDKCLFSQIVGLIPPAILRNCINKKSSDDGFRCYNTESELIAILFGQLNGCYSLRDITLGINVNTLFLKELGLTQSPARSTMSDGNARRSYEVYELLFCELITYYKGLFSKSEHYKVIEEIKGRSVKLIDSTTMTVCLNLIKWAHFRTAKGGIKAHVSFDLANQIPEVVYITDAKTDDRKALSHLNTSYQSILVYDRGYLDFAFFKDRIDHNGDFVTRLKEKISYQVLEDRPVISGKNIISDQIIQITGEKARTTGLGTCKMRRVVAYDSINNREIDLLTANLEWSAETISLIYKSRWNIELFFKGMKQNLQIKTFLGTSENACKSQIYIAMIAFLLLEVIRRCISKTVHGFSNFVNLIRICLMHYHSLSYIVNDIKEITVRLKQKASPETNLLFPI
jgi:IS4 transposase